MEIPVTKPFLPPREEYRELIDNIWERNWLTNNGPLVEQLEEHLKNYFNVPHLCYVSNGTIALQIAIKALNLKGEIITTPFSYVATTSSIVWEGGKPVFVDIEPDTLNINPELIEGAITEKTSAILATHVFGNPCDIDAVQEIADQHDLKVIYDAAHCFGSEYKGESVYNYGDVSTASFHATKVFHTVEGGATVTNDETLYWKLRRMRNFGHSGKYQFAELGINGKNSEYHAAMGLCNLRYINDILEKRRKDYNYYRKLINEFGLNDSVKLQEINDAATYNHSYMPVIFSNERILVNIIEELKRKNVNPRRYFYPALNELSYVRYTRLPQSEKIAKSILCLPMYHTLRKNQIEMVVETIANKLNTCVSY